MSKIELKNNGQISALTTPLGTVKVYFDDQEISVQHYSVISRLEGIDDACDGKERLLFEFKQDGKPHQVKAILETDAESYGDSGERYEAWTFEKNGLMLTLGVNGETGYYDHNYDYDVLYEKNTLVFDITPSTKSQWFVFGIAWGKPVDEDSADTWSGAEPEPINLILGKGDDHPDYHAIHKYCTNNRETLSKSKKCGCFYCCTIFNPTEIEEWVEQDDSAICPHCSVDAVIPESKTGEYKLTEELLKEMYKVWFE